MTLASIVIVGGGQAGFQTAASLRQEGFGGRITLVCDEAVLPYQRPPLSKTYLLGKIGFEALLFRPEKFFLENRIDIVRDRMVAIDRTGRRILLSEGSPLAYDHLVLATGARNRSLPAGTADMEGVFSLRTASDADAIGQRLKSARDIVVVGAGFIGLEVAAVARSLGASVHVLELADRPMVRALSPEMSGLFARAHTASGIVLHFGEGFARIVGEGGRVARVETTAGQQIGADLVVVGIGILPNVAAASEAGLHIDNGIKVDPYLLTNDPSISAIGDCAAFPDAATGQTIRLESVQNAVDQARAVAARLMGKSAPYAAVPWFWSDQGDLKLQIAGLTMGHDATVTVGDVPALKASVLCFRNGRLIGVESVNRPADYMAARHLLARSASLPSPDDAAAAGFELKAWELSTR